MQFNKYKRPYDNYVSQGSPQTSEFNQRAPIAKYYRKENTCCTANVTEVIKNVNCCYDSKIRSANTAFPINQDTGKRVDYSQSTSEYLASRCKTFKQKGFHFDLDTQINSGYANCGDEYRACKVVYKPNNAKFQTQGAVSGSERLLRLKYNTIKTSQKYNTNRIAYRGDVTQNVFLNIPAKCKDCYTK